MKFISGACECAKILMHLKNPSKYMALRNVITCRLYIFKNQKERLGASWSFLLNISYIWIVVGAIPLSWKTNYMHFLSTFNLKMINIVFVGKISILHNFKEFKFLFNEVNQLRVILDKNFFDYMSKITSHDMAA